MRILSWPLLLCACLVLQACSRSDEAPRSVSPPVPPQLTAAPAASPASANEGEDEDDDMAKPWGPEFEIDADASNYYGPVPLIITFTAKPLNGSPPFTYTWDFGDGSPPATGERVEHTYTTPARINAHVIGSDASKETSRVDFIMLLVSPEDFVRQKNLDPALLKNHPSPAPTS